MKVVLPGRIDKERCNLFALESFCNKRGHCLFGPRLLIESTSDYCIHLVYPIQITKHFELAPKYWRSLCAGRNCSMPAIASYRLDAPSIGVIRERRPAHSVTPQRPKPIWRKLGITHSVHDVAVAEIGLNRARVDTVVGKVESRCVPQHVRVDGQADTRILP